MPSESVRAHSAEPSASAKQFVERRRKAALEVFEQQETPTWRRSGFWTTSLRGLDLDQLEPKRYESGLPDLDLGDDEHSALIVQRGAGPRRTQAPLAATPSRTNS